MYISTSHLPCTYYHASPPHFRPLKYCTPQIRLHIYPMSACTLTNSQLKCTTNHITCSPMNLIYNTPCTSTFVYSTAQSCSSTPCKPQPRSHFASSVSLYIHFSYSRVHHLFQCLVYITSIHDFCSSTPCTQKCRLPLPASVPMYIHFRFLVYPICSLTIP